MILLPAIKAAYAAIPKTSSMSMVKWLGTHWTVKHQGAHHCYEMPLDKADWLVFTIVRFPPARLLSLWRRTNPHGRMPFKGFMKHAIRHAVYKAPGPAPWYQCNQADIIRRAGVSVVLKYEELPHCLADLPFVTPDLPWLYPYENRTRTGHAVHDRRPRNVDEINEKEAALIWEHSGPDFERFGYEWRPDRWTRTQRIV
jgi:hypothetical protein